MKFWLACFLLLFVGAELIEWFSHLGAVGSSMEASGTWLILGGMGLAAASNAAHLPKRDAQSATTSATTIEQTASAEADEALASSGKKEPNTAGTKRSESQAEPTSIAAQSKEDSISFKVRLPWR